MTTLCGRHSILKKRHALIYNAVVQVSIARGRFTQRIHESRKMGRNLQLEYLCIIYHDFLSSMFVSQMPVPSML
jgi:hypothetical protein